MNDDDDGSSRSLVRPDITTVQAQLYPYTNENCSEIVRLLNVIASTGWGGGRVELHVVVVG